MRPLSSAVLAVLLALAALARPAIAAPPSPSEVVLLKRNGISAYGEVLDGFTDRSRLHVRHIGIEEGLGALGAAQERVGPARLAIAVGQAAVDVAAGTAAQIVYVMAPDAPDSAINADYDPPLEVLFKALLEVRPGARRVGVVVSRRGARRLQRARAAAQRLGLQLVERSAEDGAQAVRALRDLAELSGAAGPAVDALWIGADPQLLTTPVFQYVLQLQLRTGLPVLAATRQQVRSGAFLAVDWAPRAVGYRLAAVVNLLLDGVSRPELSGREDPAGLPQVSINKLLAGKLGVDTEARRAAGWRVEE